MVSGYVQAGLDKEALKLFHEMQAAGKKLDKVILTSALSACAQLGALDQGRWIHAHIKRSGMQIDSILGCALIDMYAKCGDMEEAIEMFDKMEAKSVHAWTANLVTFTAILTACSYAGLIEEGKLLFNSIEEDHILNPTIEHYGCMVDLLGRAGFLTEAKDLIKRMPVKPNAIIWGSLLKACKIHGNLELGKQIGKLVIEMNPDHGGRYIHLANIHAAAKEWELAAKARRQMKEHGVLKFPGCSTISLNSIVHEFLAGDRTHPEAGTIYSTWNQIADRLLQEGYKPVTRELMLDLEDSEKETVVSQHSEKLAITFGLIHGKPGTVIRIFKNLRVCEDCHTAMKLISRIYNRQIVMRDRTRFHCFRDGECSCADYW
ncbi:Pentatricopeptide repeat-containing protein At5g66520 [Linum perenne]